MTLRTQMLMRPYICHIGPSIPVTKHWYDVTELCVKYYVSNNEKAIWFVGPGKS